MEVANVQLRSFLTLALDGAELLTWRPSCFPLPPNQKKNPFTRWTGCSLDVLQKVHFLGLLEFEPSIVPAPSLVPIHRRQKLHIMLLRCICLAILCWLRPPNNRSCKTGTVPLLRSLISWSMKALIAVWSIDRVPIVPGTCDAEPRIRTSWLCADVCCNTNGG